MTRLRSSETRKSMCPVVGTYSPTNPERLVADPLAVMLVASPAYVEADMPLLRRGRRRHGVQEVVEIGHGEVMRPHPRSVEVVVHVDRRVRKRDRPKQPGGLDARLEVVNLGGQVANGACEEINSDKAECSPPLATIPADIVAAHEAHVGIEGVRRTVAAARLALHLGRRHNAPKIRDRRHLEAHRRRKHVNERILRHRVKFWSKPPGIGFGCAPHHASAGPASSNPTPDSAPTATAPRRSICAREALSVTARSTRRPNPPGTSIDSKCGIGTLPVTSDASLYTPPRPAVNQEGGYVSGGGWDSNRGIPGRGGVFRSSNAPPRSVAHHRRDPPASNLREDPVHGGTTARIPSAIKAITKTVASARHIPIGDFRSLIASVAKSPKRRSPRQRARRTCHTTRRGRS